MNFLLRQIFFFVFLLVLTAVCPAQAGLPGAAALQSVSTADLADNLKTEFIAGDYIRYNVSFSAPVFSLVFASGAVTFASGTPERLALQFTAVRKGESRIFWDSIVPDTAGQATLIIYYMGIPAGFSSATASFTVSSGEGPPAGEAAFIGSTACIGCHAGFHKDIVDAYQQSGHHYALSSIAGSTPAFPDFCPGVPEPPAGFAWQDILYVIGGYGWQAAFAASDGHVLTTGFDGVNTQYNFANSLLGTPAEFVPYAADQTAPKPFDCGSCHTTGYTAADNASTDSLISGSWNEEGIGCEACHGPGSLHRDSPSQVKPALDPKTACAGCHGQALETGIKAEDGLIFHTQQSAELSAGAKSFFTCDGCHNAHASAHYDAGASGEALIKECTSCHTDKTVGLGMQSLKCIDCHMPYAVKAGAYISFKDADNNSLAQGDMRAHLFRINTEAAAPGEMFSADGKQLAVDGSGKSSGLTLDFVCLGCHRDGGRAQRAYTFEQVKGFAGSVH